MSYSENRNSYSSHLRKPQSLNSSCIFHTNWFINHLDITREYILHHPNMLLQEKALTKVTLSVLQFHLKLNMLKCVTFETKLYVCSFILKYLFLLNYSKEGMTV